MKQCPKCGKTHDDAVTFCDVCGTPLAAPAAPAYSAPYTPAYTAPAAPKPIPARSGVGIAGFVVGLISFIMFILGFIIAAASVDSLARYQLTGAMGGLLAVGLLIIFAFIVAIPGLILSIIGVAKKAKSKALPVLGMIFSIIVMVGFIVLITVGKNL